MTRESTTYDEWGRDPKAPLSARLGGMMLARFLGAVYATSRMVATGFYEEIVNAHRGMYAWALWHHHIALQAFFCPKGYLRTCMASRSRDGELLVQMVSRLETHSVRGSSTALDGTDKGGALAFRQMVRVAKEGRHQLLITPDGPKGPPERVKMGVVSLASITGYRVCPVGFAASRSFRLSTWDRTIFPLPFGRLSIHCAEPLAVPRTRDADVLEAKRAEIEERLVHADREARRSLGLPTGE